MNDLMSRILQVSRARVLDLGAIDASVQCERASFADALRGKETLSVIAEFKRSSPSEGVIAEGVNLGEQVCAYRDQGAAAVSILTEPSCFGGSYGDLDRAAHAVTLPLLMKDFVVDEAQLRAGVLAGASAALLIVRCLPAQRLSELALCCVELGLTPLIECHNEADLESALAVEEAVIGINNRDLETLEVDTMRCLRLLPMVPADRVVVAESGYCQPEQLKDLCGLADAVLIGTAFMRGLRPDSMFQGVTG